MQAACPGKAAIVPLTSLVDRLVRSLSWTGSLGHIHLGLEMSNPKHRELVIRTREHGEDNWEAEYWPCSSVHRPCGSGSHPTAVPFATVHIYCLLSCLQMKWRIPECNFPL